MPWPWCSSRSQSARTGVDLAPHSGARFGSIERAGLSELLPLGERHLASPSRSVLTDSTNALRIEGRWTRTRALAGIGAEARITTRTAAATTAAASGVVTEPVRTAGPRPSRAAGALVPPVADYGEAGDIDRSRRSSHYRPGGSQFSGRCRRQAVLWCGVRNNGARLGETTGEHEKEHYHYTADTHELDLSRVLLVSFACE